MKKQSLDDDVIEIAYILESAAWGEITWEEVLKRMAEIIPGTSLHSVHHEPSASKALTLSWYGVDDAIADSYRRYYISINPWAPILTARPSGTVFVSEKEMPAYTFKNTEYYCDYHAKLGKRIAWAGIKIDVGPQDNFFLCFNYSLNASRMLDSHCFRLLSAIKMPLLRVLAAEKRVSNIRQRVAAEAAISLSLADASLVVDEKMKLFEMNLRAEAFISQGDFVRCRQGIISFRNNALNNIVAEKVRVLNGSPLGPPQMLGVQWGFKNLIIKFTRVSRDLGKPLLNTPALILISIIDASLHKGELDINLLKNLYKVTDTEAKLCHLLAKGFSLIESAEMIGITYEHARQRIKIILGKTGTKNKTELTSLLNQLICWIYY
ncbi:helix-turn-helix transcriptional regulator [Brenneria izadpanahii]|uniref:Helix-turn-helix transcriptional regulator n=1 Tax=Brenneria izadpanahii TaxID=2722756 RepID=A0ABX7US85_9GAMM|nr:helix-turn-helix transcriptional regulator [Brenneria izadpanahii]QTF08586.1 helix-turn-helix transcriptional regulator [Brenneria izadpanahii]